jgi:hypothetical protein
MTARQTLRRWWRDLCASFAALADSTARDVRLRLYGDPKTVEDLGIAAAKAGLTVDEVETAVRVYRRAEWLEMEGRSLVGVYRDIETLQRVRAAHIDYRRSGDAQTLGRALGALLGSP